MLHGRPYDDGHEHEYTVHEDDDSWLYEDGAVIITEECRHEEILSSAHSERHDETFYETGPQCDSYRSYRFDLTTIEAAHRTESREFLGTLTESREEFLGLYDRCPLFVEEIEERAYERLQDGGIVDFLDRESVDESSHMVEVEYDGQPLYLTYELDGVTEE